MRDTDRQHLAAALFAAVIVVAGLGAAPASAQVDSPMRFLVHDRSGNHLATLQIGEPLDLRVGQEAVVRAVMPGGRRGEHYPPMAYEVTSGRGKVEIAPQRNGAVVVRAVAAGSEPGSVIGQVRWALTDDADRNGLRPNQRDGYLSVRVLTSKEEVDPEYGSPDFYSNPAEQRAFRVIDAFYQGILLRRPEDAQTDRVVAISRGGWSEVLRIAEEIARSEESAVVGRRTSAEDRLESLYRHLLGVGTDQVSRQEWERNLDLVSYGRLPEVVETMVRSSDFGYRFGMDTAYPRYR